MLRRRLMYMALAAATLAPGLIDAESGIERIELRVEGMT
jgi:hypothetical protein